ncbi:recombination regulator RecX [Aquincola sp. MAHUQ-54]|uniref:Regulatory protein RecX n=1 Tax=Aquincola agrisoli TaxID=3119538 RepID=A0AAW9QJG8_9BURK
MPAPARISLKARALQLLAQREHSRSELRRKLMRHAVEACNAVAATGEEASSAPGPCLDKLLDWLEAHRYLSEERFVESRVHARSPRFGNLRIQQELARHGVALDSTAATQLQLTEFERAQAVWRRKFGSPATDAAQRAKQMRFLAGRGFSGDVIRRVVRGGDGE